MPDEGTTENTVEAPREESAADAQESRAMRRSSSAADAREFSRVRPFTIALVVIFILSVVALLSVINLQSVQEFFGGQEALLWVLRGLTAVMIVSLVVWLGLMEKAYTNYIGEQLDKRNEANRQLSLLLEAGQATGSTLELPMILEELLGYAFTVTGATMGAIYLNDKASSSLKAALIGGVDEKKVMFKEFPLEQGVMGTVATERRLMAINDLSEADRRDNVFFGAAQPGSQLVAPLVARDSLVGVMVTATEERRAYSDDEKRLVAGLAEMGSLPIANAQLYRIARRSLDVAAQQRVYTESVLDQMVAGVMTVDRDRRVAAFNREAQRLTGYSLEERNRMLLRPELSLDENPLGPLEHGMLEVMEHPGLVREGEALIMKKDRTLLPISYRIYTVSDGSSVLGASAVFMETGERRKERSSDGPIDYTAFLRSLGARVEMLYTNPLSRVLDELGDMDVESWTRTRDDMLGLLRTGFDTLVGLLADVEKYLNCVTTREWDSKTEIELGRLVASIIDETLKSPGREGVVVLAELDGLPDVFGFERMIRAALAEVIENAVLAASDGGKRVEVSGSDAPGKVRVEVRDTGRGIPPGELASVFIPFFSTREGRSGLGLTVVERVMRASGGAVGVVESSGGATFYLEFPTSPAGASMPEREESDRSAATGGATGDLEG